MVSAVGSELTAHGVVFMAGGRQEATFASQSQLLPGSPLAVAVPLVTLTTVMMVDRSSAPFASAKSSFPPKKLRQSQSVVRDLQIKSSEIRNRAPRPRYMRARCESKRLARFSLFFLLGSTPEVERMKELDTEMRKSSAGLEVFDSSMVPNAASIVLL
jgi:hypothetical protein